MALLEWPDRVPGRIWCPDHNYSRQRKPPTGLVIHSGDTAARVAEAALDMDISYHLAYSATHDQIVQLVSLQRRAWHAGAEGNGWLGIALSGPDEQIERSESELADWCLLIPTLQDLMGGTLESWCRHSDLTSRRHDPGPGFRGPWIDALTRAGIRWGLPSAAQ